MPVTKEFNVQMEDRPGTLGKFCKALADRGVNIVAFQAFPGGGKSTVRFVADNPTTAKTVLDNQKLTYTETQVAQAKLPHQPGALGRAASKLGDANVNINYAYAGVEPGTNAPVLIFGAADTSRAATLLDEVSSVAA